MHHTISYYLAQARIADLRHDARRAARARAGRRTRPEHCEHSGPRLHGLDRGCRLCWARLQLLTRTRRSRQARAPALPLGERISHVSRSSHGRF